MGEVHVAPTRRLKNILGLAAILALAGIALLPLIHITVTVIAQGASTIAKTGLLEFLTGTPHPMNPRNPGGIGPAIEGTLIILALSLCITIPIALNTSIFIAEFKGTPISRTALLLSLLLVEFPTILVGLYIYSTVVEPMHRFSLLAGALAVSIVMLPYMVVEMSEALKSIPRELREAAYSLGASRFKTVYRILLGAAKRGILAGVLLGAAKAVGETAPLLFTLYGAFNTYPHSILDPGAAVSLLIYEYAWQPTPGFRELAWGAALVLMAMVALLIAAARILAGRRVIY
ncbi:MAG: phosphate ABC transporter permease PstA [Crenarchaeota archaeon]|nr:phosphate ABC transporter permease PstA [Thermoproteota archaeon]